MSTIVLAGDSWGIGVFGGVGSNYGPLGIGPASILQEHGHTVINISKAGGSNWLQLDRMEGNWNNTGKSLYGHSHSEEYKEIAWDTVDYIVFLQTDIFREHYLYVKKPPDAEFTQWKELEHKFVDSLLNYDSLDDMIADYFSKFYTKLNEIALHRNVQVLMLGCWGQLHPSVNQYSNLTSVVPSATKLLIPNLLEDVYLSDPEWYSQLADTPKFMQKFGSEFKPMSIVAAEKLDLIYKHWKEVHPDITGYSKLVDELLPYFGKTI
jgi:hypothetical protein